jgi:glycosyltransferase involved in cell wall biosynthesis
MPVEANPLILGIDASNLRGGGGVTHLVELLAAADPMVAGFKRVIVWGGRDTLNRIADKPWLDKRSDLWLERSLPWRSWWQRRRLSQQARSAECDLLFIPGGSYAGNFRPVVTMSQNLLPFEWCELKRFGFSWMSLKLVLLRLIQGASFRRADGLIFLTRYAERTVLTAIGGTRAATTVIAHGIAPRFLLPIRRQLAPEEFSAQRPFRLLYVSIVDAYKHQDKVAAAVGLLHEEGLPISLDLVGPAYGPALEKLQQAMKQANRTGEVVHYHGPVAHERLHECYAGADAFVFASSCENLPIILLEGMAAGLPVACSERGPMPEVLGDAGLYFNPESVDSIAAALRKLAADSDLRQRLAQAAFRHAAQFSWKACAGQTFAFLAQTAQRKWTPAQADRVTAP